MYNTFVTRWKNKLRNPKFEVNMSSDFHIQVNPYNLTRIFIASKKVDTFNRSPTFLPLSLHNVNKL